MNETINAPRDWVERIAMLRIPALMDRLIQELMDRNNAGQLSDQDRNDLAGLVELSEQLSILRAEALILLGRKI